MNFLKPLNNPIPVVVNDLKTIITPKYLKAVFNCGSFIKSAIGSEKTNNKKQRVRLEHNVIFSDDLTIERISLGLLFIKSAIYLVVEKPKPKVAKDAK